MSALLLLALLFSLDAPSRSALGPKSENRAQIGKDSVVARSLRREIEVVPPEGYTASDFVVFLRRRGCAWSRRSVHSRGRRIEGSGVRIVEVLGEALPRADSVLAVVSDDGLWADSMPLTAIGTTETIVLHPRARAALSLDLQLPANPREDLPNGDWSLAQERGPLVELTRLSPTPGYAGTYSASAREDLNVIALPPGTYRARVFADAYEPTESRFELYAGEHTFASVQPRPLAPDARADLRVQYVFEGGPPHRASGGSGNGVFTVEVCSVARGSASWVQALPAFSCATTDTPPSVSAIRLERVGTDGGSALGFTLTDLPRNAEVVVRSRAPAGFLVAGQVVAQPGAGTLRIPVRNAPREGGFGFRVIDGVTGLELESYSLSAVRARADFPLPLGDHASSAGLVATQPPSGIVWRVDVPGFAPAFGTTDAFDSDRIVTVQLQPGWGEDVVVEDVDGAPLAGVAVCADGVQVGTSDAEGRVRLTLPARPRVLTGRLGDWVHATPRPGASSRRIVLAPPL